jgi:ribosomal protein S18 acetylase RimI-like enzyme
MDEYVEYVRIASDTGMYQEIELEILEETIKTQLAEPGKPYMMVEVRDGKALAGFALFHKIHGTDCTWDIHTILIDLNYQGMGIGSRLLALIEEKICLTDPIAVVRVEISKKREVLIEDGLFLSAGYMLIGHIPDYYEPGNDYCIYTRYLGPKIEQKHDEETEPDHLVAHE